MTEQEKAIKGLEQFITDFKPFCGNKADWQRVYDAIALLKAQEPREPHYTKLEYIVNGMPVAINHPECPKCYDNGLVLWDAGIEKGAAYCKRCGQAVKWE